MTPTSRRRCACTAELCLHTGRDEVNVAGGGGVDMRMTEQRLHRRQIHPRLGHPDAERVPQRMWMPRRHTGFRR